MLSKNHPRPARYLGRLPSGQRIYRYQVLRVHNDSTLCATVARHLHEVTAASPTDAIEEVRAQHDAPETEYYTWGPRGGRTDRYTGYESFIGRALSQLRPIVQEKLL